jgi:hypothetical protein
MRRVQHDLDPHHADLLEPKPGPEAAVGKLTMKEAEPLTFSELRNEVSRPQSDHVMEKPRQSRTVWFNAWMYQSSEQIWAGLAHAICPS